MGSSGDAAVEGTDYETVADLTLTIDAGETLGTASFTLTPTDDDVDEGRRDPVGHGHDHGDGPEREWHNGDHRGRRPARGSGIRRRR